jgi:hypothetical protein
LKSASKSEERILAGGEGGGLMEKTCRVRNANFPVVCGNKNCKRQLRRSEEFFIHIYSAYPHKRTVSLGRAL